MNESEKWDRMLRQALAADEEPGERLNESLVQRYEERFRMKRGYRKKWSAGVMAAVLALAVSVTAYAATQVFSSKEVAEHLGEKALARAFESAGALVIGRTATSGGYEVTLHGIVSGAGLRDIDAPSGISPDRTYAVVSVARQDGSPMPDTSDPEYGKDPFFISPLVKGLKPWQVNIFTMNGGHAEFVADGVAYRLIECDGVEMFADRGVYLAVSSGSSFFRKEAFKYDERTGEIIPNGDYSGAALLFDLPLDKAKADPAKAESYLRELLKEPSSDTAPKAIGEGRSIASGDGADLALSSDSTGDAEADLVNQIESLRSRIPEGTVIEESIQEVGYDDKGNALYDYDGWQVAMSLVELFPEGLTSDWKVAGFSGDDTGYKALQFSRDEQGVVKGRIILLK
jgi:hypothetical protein